MKRVWIDKTSHTHPMVCFGEERDHLVLSPLGAKEIGEEFLRASEEANALWQNTNGESSKGEEDAGS